jgi:hypothetical protein
MPAKRLTTDNVVDTLNMLFETDPLAMHQLVNLRVACHTLKYKRPDLAYHTSELEFPVMGVLELLNVVLRESTGQAIAFEIDKRKRRCRFMIVDSDAVKSGVVISVPEVT